MRYLIAITFAAAGALLMSLFVSNHAATLLTSKFTFQSPDEVSTFHSSAFMALNVAGLIVGWIIGYAIGGNFAPDDSDLDEVS